MAQAQQWKQAERVINTIQDSFQQARALSAFCTALAQAQQWKQELQMWEQAERVIDMIQGNSRHAEVLSALSTALAQAQQWAEAESVIGTIQDSFEQTRALRELGIAMASADEFEQLLHVIQRAWRQVETRVEALTLFSIASAFISRRPDVGIAFFDAFTWVDTFFGG